MNQRIDKRLKKSLLAYSNGDSTNLLGVISNISRNGIYVESSVVYNPESELSLVLAVFNELYHVKGVVRWVKRPGDKLPTDIPIGMGIRITEAPDDYLNYVEYLRYQKSHTMQLTH